MKVNATENMKYLFNCKRFMFILEFHNRNKQSIYLMISLLAKILSQSWWYTELFRSWLGIISTVKLWSHVTKMMKQFDHMIEPKLNCWQFSDFSNIFP
jgi:hypothetical protein